MESKPKSSSLEKHTSRDAIKSITSMPLDPQHMPPKMSKVILGICAMKKKVESKPMREILSRLTCPEIEIVLMW